LHLYDIDHKLKSIAGHLGILINLRESSLIRRTPGHLQRECSYRRQLSLAESSRGSLKSALPGSQSMLDSASPPEASGDSFFKNASRHRCPGAAEKAHRQDELEV
jgi:hypothetical protein